MFILICCRLEIAVIFVDHSGTDATLALKWRRGTNVLVHGMLTPAGKFGHCTLANTWKM